MQHAFYSSMIVSKAPQNIKSVEDSSEKTGRILGGFHLSCLFFFGCTLFLCKEHLYIFLNFHQLLHLISCFAIVRVCFFLLFQKFSVFDAQVLSLWQLFQASFIKSSFCGLMQRDFLPGGCPEISYYTRLCGRHHRPGVSGHN